MAFALTVIYVALSLLSPNVLPEAIWSLHVNIILGIATILALLPQLGTIKLGTLPDSYFVAGLVLAVGFSALHLGFSAAPLVMFDSLPIFIVFYFVLISCKSVGQLKAMMYVMVVVALFIFSQGWLADRAHDTTNAYLIGEGAGDNLVLRYRGLGVLSDPNDLAQFFVTLIPLLFLRWEKGGLVSNVLLTLVPAAALMAGMYFTHSRGGAIALLAVVLFGFKDKIGVTLSSILAVGLFFGMMALNISGGRGMDDDDGGRVAAWSTGLEVFKSHPIVGIGLGEFAEYSDTGHTAHNSYILSLSETGLIGYFCWMGTIVANFTGLSQIARWKAGDSSNAKSSAGERAAMPPHLRYRPAAAQARGVPGTLPLRSVALAAPGFPSVSYGAAAAPSWAPPSVRFAEGSVDGKDSDADLIHAAKVLRISFVGLLTSAFFLSRSFAMVFYVMLGMSASVRMLFLARHPDQVMDRKLMLKRVVMVLIGSVIFLYLFVRIRGIH